jgi:hypothetical protein
MPRLDNEKNVLVDFKLTSVAVLLIRRENNELADSHATKIGFLGVVEKGVAGRVADDIVRCPSVGFPHLFKAEGKLKLE